MLNTARNRWAPPGVRKCFMARLRCRVGWCEFSARHCQLEQSEGDFRRFASAIHQVACDV